MISMMIALGTYQPRIKAGDGDVFYFSEKPLQGEMRTELEGWLINIKDLELVPFQATL